MVSRTAVWVLAIAGALGVSGVSAAPVGDGLAHLYVKGEAVAPPYVATIDHDDGAVVALISGHVICEFTVPGSDSLPKHAASRADSEMAAFQRLNEEVAALCESLPASMSEAATLDTLARHYRRSPLVDSVRVDRRVIFVRYRGWDLFLHVMLPRTREKPVWSDVPLREGLKGLCAGAEAGDLVFVHGCGQSTTISRVTVRSHAAAIREEISIARSGASPVGGWRYLHEDEVQDLARAASTRTWGGER